MGAYDGTKKLNVVGPYDQNSTDCTTVSNSATTHLTSPDGKRYLVDNIILCEYAGSGTTVTAHRIPKSGTLATTNRILSLLPVAANETVVFAPDKGIYLYDGDFIQLVAANASRVTATINYRAEV